MPNFDQTGPAGGGGARTGGRRGISPQGQRPFDGRGAGMGRRGRGQRGQGAGRGMGRRNIQ